MTTDTTDKVKKSTKKKGLKKGSLEFLLSSAGLDETTILDDTPSSTGSSVSGSSKTKHDSSNGSTSVSGKTNTGVLQVDIEKIVRSPYQPRKTFAPESLQELADSIKAKGLIQPIVVRKKGVNYELIAGERRWRACQMAGLHQIPIVIRQVDDETALVMAIVENIQREDLNPIEEARGFERLLQEFALTQQQVADVVGRSRSAVTNLLRLLSLDSRIQKLVEDGELEMGHARALLSLDNSKQIEVANRIMMNSATVRETEQWVREMLNPIASSKSKESYISDPNISSLQNKLSEALGAKVIINHASSGKGKLVINYHSIDELDGILSKIH